MDHLRLNLLDFSAFHLFASGDTMLRDDHEKTISPVGEPDKPMLNEITRQRLGRQLQAMYEPVIDEQIDPRLAELMRQLDFDKGL